MELWRKVFRQGVTPQLSDAALVALRAGLASDDDRLVQGATTSPPPLMCAQDFAVEGACPIGFAGWMGEGLATVGEVEEFFARKCFDVDQAMGEPAACRYFLNHVDEVPREQMVAELFAEVELEIQRRSLLPAAYAASTGRVA